MSPTLPHETGLLLALRRVRDGRVIAHGSDLYTHKGRPLPRVLVPSMNELFANGHARLEEREDGPERHVLITEAGEQLLAELEASTKIPNSQSSTVDELESRRGARPMKASAPIVWFSVNLRSGGTVVTPGDPLFRRHGSLSMEWLRRFPEIIHAHSPEQPDVIFLQEAKWFNHHGDELLLFVERQLRDAGIGRYRGFLTLSHRSHHHQVVFINTQRLTATHHWRGADPDESRGLYGWVQVVVDSDHDRTLWLKSVHLDPRDGDVRLAEAKQIHAAVRDGQRAIMAGDFNSITSRRTPEDGEPQRQFSAMPPAKRYGKGVWPPTKPDGDTDPDTRALDYLIDTGWNCAAITLNNTTPTVAPGYDRGGELIIDRCLTRGDLALHSMWVDTSNLPYSDHRALGGRIAIVGNGQREHDHRV